MIYTAHYVSPLGDILLAEREGALVGLWIAGQDYMSDLHGESVEERETPLLVRTKAWLLRYFAGERPAIAELPLAPRGSAFRRAVWNLLCGIPYGATTANPACPRRPSAAPSGTTPSPSSSPVIALSERTAASPDTAAVSR